MAEVQPRPKVGETCALLRSERRRRALRAVADAGETTRRELAGELADDDSAAATDRAELSLYHCHLPKLADAGAVRYDLDDATIAITERGRRMAAFLDDVERTIR